MTKFFESIMAAKGRPRFLTVTLIFIAALIVRTLSAGVEYLPILDDSIQYISFPSSEDYGMLIREQGLFASRPLAAIMDLFVIGAMRNNLIIPALLMGILHGIGGVMFLRLFDKIWGNVGIAFTVLYALLPLGVEGVHWLSASSRIVPGLLFTAIAANLLENFIGGGKWWNAALFPIAALLSYGFYEQILALSFALSALQFLRRVKNRRAWIALTAIPMVAVYFIFTGLNASDGALGSRMEIVLPNTPWYYDTFLPDIVRQIGAAFIKGGARTLFVGFVRGVSICMGSIGGILCLIAAILIGGAVYFVTPHTMNQGAKQRAGVWIWGVLLFLAPIAPYFVIANPWFSLRATVASYVGAGLIIDALIRLITRRERIYAAVCAVIAAVCLVAGFSEVHDYYSVGEYDAALAEEILANSDEMSGRVGILRVEERPLGQNYSYHEHIASAGSSDWSLYGKLVAVGGEELVGYYPVPLATEGYTFYAAWNRDTKRISGFEQIWLWDAEARTLTKMEIRQTAEQNFDILYPDGTKWGYVFEEGEYGYVEIMADAQSQPPTIPHS